MSSEKKNLPGIDNKEPSSLDKSAPQADSPVPAPPSPQSRLNSFRSLMETWLIWRLTAFGPWYWFLGAVVHKATGSDLLPSPGWIFFTPFIAVILLLLIGPWGQAVLYVAYLLVFPIVIATLLIWRAPRFSRKVFALALSPLATCCVIFLMAMCWVILLTVENASAILVVAIAEAILNTLLLLCALRLAGDPLGPFLRLVQLLESFLLWLETVNLARPTSEDQRAKTTKTHLDLLGFFETGFAWFTDKIDHMARRTIVPLFSWTLVALFLVTVTGYGIAFSGSQNRPTAAFAGLDSRLVNCWAYSLTLLTTSPLPDVKPETGLAQFLYCMELFSTFVLVSLFFSMFSAAMGVHGPHRIQDFDSLRRRIHAWIEKQRLRLNSEVIDAKPVEPKKDGEKPPAGDSAS